jgi:predicted PurR-regulated permease PerM
MTSKAPINPVSIERAGVERPASGRHGTGTADPARTSRRRNLAIYALLVLAAFYTLYLARDLFIPIALAVMLALVLSPLTRFITRLVRSRTTAAGIVVIGLVVTTASGATLVYGPVASWVQSLPRNLWILEYKLNAITKPIDEIRKAVEKAETAAKGGGDESKSAEVVVKRPGLLSQFLGGVQIATVQLVLVLILLYYLLSSGHFLAEKAVNLIRSEDRRASLSTILLQIERQTSQFLFAITVINIALGVVIGLAMFALGIPNALMIGIAAGLLNFIPYLGPLTVIAMILLIGMTNFSGVAAGFVAAGIYLTIVAVESEIVKPLVMGRRFAVNPVLIIVSLVVWGWLWGVAGLLVAIPILVAFKVVCDHVDELSAVSEWLGARGGTGDDDRDRPRWPIRLFRRVMGSPAGT